RAASLRGFGALVSELGGEADRLLERFGIAPDVLESDDGLLSITAHDRMLDAAADELSCPDFGLRLAERQDLTILGPVARAIRSSETAVEALEYAAQFLFVHSPVLTIGVDNDPWHRRGVIALTYRKQLSESPYSPQAVELGLGLFYRVAVQLLGSGTGLRSVEVPHGPLSPVDRYLDFFGADVKFDRPVAALRVDRRILDSSFASADEEIRRAAIDHLTRPYSAPTLSRAARASGTSSSSGPPPNRSSTTSGATGPAGSSPRPPCRAPRSPTWSASRSSPRSATRSAGGSASPRGSSAGGPGPRTNRASPR